MYETLSALITFALALLAFAFAFWKGDKPERTISMAMLAAWLASGFFTKREQYIGPSWGVLIVDVALLIAITAVSLSTRRTWTAAAAGFQLINVLLHFALLIDLRISVYAYRLGLAIWSILAVLALLTGVVQVMRYDRQREASG